MEAKWEALKASLQSQETLSADKLSEIENNLYLFIESLSTVNVADDGLQLANDLDHYRYMSQVAIECITQIRKTGSKNCLLTLCN